MRSYMNLVVLAIAASTVPLALSAPIQITQYRYPRVNSDPAVNVNVFRRVAPPRFEYYSSRLVTGPSTQPPSGTRSSRPLLRVDTSTQTTDPFQVIPSQVSLPPTTSDPAPAHPASDSGLPDSEITDHRYPKYHNPQTHKGEFDLPTPYSAASSGRSSDYYTAQTQMTPQSPLTPQIPQTAPTPLTPLTPLTPSPVQEN